MHRSAEEISEIERHKYFLSENRGEDVGWEFAERDWERQFGEQWRRDQGSTRAATCESNATATACCQQTTAVGRSDGTTSVEPEVHSATIRKDPADRTTERGALRWLLARLFPQQTS